MNLRMGSPYILINPATKKNLAVLLIKLAKKNIGNEILATPALIVKSLNGIGVKPAVNTIQKSQSRYKS